MSSIEQKIDRVVEEVKELKREVRKLKKALILDITKVEVWTDISVAPEYMISSFGRVMRKNGFMPKITLDRSRGYYRVALNGKLYYLHRLLAQAFVPNPQGKPFVDHIDGDRKNNSLSNLRWCTYAENNRNVGKRITNTSGYTGVTFNKRYGKWQAQIKVDGKNKYLGLFRTKEEAAAAYEEAAKREFGEFYRKT